MKIETKYDIGQEVYITSERSIVQGEIQDLRVTAVFLDPKPVVEYTVREIRNKKLKLYHRYEEEIFPNKEELLKSL